MNNEGYIDAPNFVAVDYAMTVADNSMINARIFNGDLVYIRQQDTVENGEIAAVFIGDELMLRRVWFFDNSIILEPSNPLFHHRSFVDSERDQVCIVGKVVALTATLS